jgi:hypothetical protein
MGIATAVLSILLAASPTTLISTVGEVEVDHGQGTVTARAGAAADIRMPSPNAARPGAERRAQAAADERLRDALRALMKKEGEALAAPAVDAALAKAVTSRTEYQSNGGVFLWRQVSFADFSGGKAGSSPALTLSVPAMPARIVPTVKIGDQKVFPAYVVLRRESPGKEALAAKWDKKTSTLSIAGADPALRDKLAGAVVAIYVGKLEP